MKIINCDISGNPAASIPDGTNFKFQKGLKLYCFETKEEFDVEIEKKLPESNDVKADRNVDDYIDRLDNFCTKFVKRMKRENIKIGIGAAPLAVVKQVSEISGPALRAVELGSLRVAIDEIKNIDPAALDGVYLTAARLKEKRNDIETFLKIPLSVNYTD